MNYLAFISGLLLPWLAGAVWLAVAEAPFVRPAPAQGLRRAGYGFFLGYALLYGVMSGFSEFSGQVPYYGVMAVFAAMTVAGALLLWLRGRRLESARTQIPWLQDFRQLTPATKIFLVLLLSWLALHVAFAAVEIFLRPVYPWDAWQTWMYRAKAWFLSGAMTDLVSERDWLESGLITAYTTQGYSYPGLPSAIPYWAALSLGSWSETLVNVPVLLCSVCIGLALYAQLRGLGASLLASAVAVFLLWSTPMFGVHSALGGYADIWMAGFAGLGFVALIASAGAHRAQQITLGLLMLALGMGVKEEGVVWLYAALLLMAIVALPPRVVLGALILVGVVGFAGAMTGTAHVDLPLLGRAGIVDNQLFIPFVGQVTLEAHDVGQAYLRSLLAMGSWNLLWVLLPFALLAAARSPRNSLRRTALVFLLVFAATQIFVFGFTDRGMYAGSYTAINRLPLQFLPALVFAGTVIAWSWISKPLDIQWKRIIGAGSISAVVVISGLVFMIRNDLPGEAPEPMAFTPARLQLAMGEGSRDADGLSITAYRDGFALVSSGPVRIDADSVSLLKYSADAGEGSQSPAFFWRRQDSPGEVVRFDLPSGEGSADLSAAAGWNGEVIEVGFLFVEPEQGSARLGPFSLEAPGLAVSLEAMREGWFRFEPWSQGSINFLYGGARNPEYPLPLVLAAWMLLAFGLALGLAWLGPRESRASWPVSLVVLSLAAWMALDVRWTVNGFRQSAATYDLFAGLAPQQRLDKSMDGPLYQFIEQIKTGYLGAQPVRLVLIAGNERGANYLVKRARYHLLPHNALIMSQLSGAHRKVAFDYVLFIDDFSGLSLQQIAARLPVDEEWRARLRGVSGNRFGILVSVAPEE